jgi:hypothetical protein
MSQCKLEIHQCLLLLRLIDYLRFYIPLKNFSLICRRHHSRWRIAKFKPKLREGSLSSHTCCDTGPRFFQSHPKDHPIKSPLTTHMGMWRIYSNPHPHGALLFSIKKLTIYTTPNCIFVKLQRAGKNFWSTIIALFWTFCKLRYRMTGFF